MKKRVLLPSMLFFLVIGIILGAVSVLFILQNSMPITVTFLAWNFSGSLSLVLFAAVISGIVITLLVLLPSFITDDAHLSILKNQKRDLERELAEKNRILEDTTPVVVVDSSTL
jgi:uncharacterized integral membrane protein